MFLRSRWQPELPGDRLRVAVTVSPVDGRANEAVIRLLAETLGVVRAAVHVVSGQGSRRKTGRIEGVRLSTLLAVCAL